MILGKPIIKVSNRAVGAITITFERIGRDAFLVKYNGRVIDSSGCSTFLSQGDVVTVEIPVEAE